ncbi:MAG: ATPase, partial [Candidatus Brocadia sp.]
MKTRLKTVIRDRNFVKEKVETMKREVGKVIVGQEELIEGIIIALLSDGHILLEG